MNDWLSEYAYRTELAWWIFPVAGCAAIAPGCSEFSNDQILAGKPGEQPAFRLNAD